MKLKIINAKIDLVRTDDLDATRQQMEDILDEFLAIVVKKGYSCYSSWGLVDTKESDDEQGSD